MKSWNIIIKLYIETPDGYDLKKNMDYFVNEMCVKIEAAALDVSIRNI
jgi:hypothetical protein